MIHFLKPVVRLIGFQFKSWILQITVCGHIAGSGAPNFHSPLSLAVLESVLIPLQLTVFIQQFNCFVLTWCTSSRWVVLRSYVTLVAAIASLPLSANKSKL